MPEQKPFHYSICLVMAHDSQIGIDAGTEGCSLIALRFMVPYNCVVGLNGGVEIAGGSPCDIGAVRLDYGTQVFHTPCHRLEINLIRCICTPC
jgi:hypothetical protein